MSSLDYYHREKPTNPFKALALCLLIAVLILWFIALFVFDLPNQQAKPVGAVSDVDEELWVLDQINAYRVQMGMDKTVTDPQVCQYAELRAVEISTEFSHRRFHLGAGKFYGERFELATENLAMEYPYQEIVAAWINSPSHNKQLLADTPYICVAQYGDYWAMEGLREKLK